MSAGCGSWGGRTAAWIEEGDLGWKERGAWDWGYEWRQVGCEGELAIDGAGDPAKTRGVGGVCEVCTEQGGLGGGEERAAGKEGCH